ncbi:MAG: hypothetical protein ACE5GD_09850 [Candidatus Geothermarchaeales archaeon]
MVSYETKIEDVVYDPQSLRVTMALGEPNIHTLILDGLKNGVVAFNDQVVIKRGTETLFSGIIEKLSFKVDTKDTIIVGKGESYRAFRKTYTGSFVDATLLDILCDILNDTDIQDTANVTGESVGTGDGSTKVFYLDNDLVKYNSETIYQDGSPLGGYQTPSSASASSSGDSTIFSEGFESYNLGDLNGQGGWSGATEFDVTDTLAQEGTQSCLCGDPGASDKFIEKSLPQKTSLTLTYYVRVSGYNERAWVQLYEDATRIMYVEVSDIDDKIIAPNWFEVGVLHNHWYKIEITIYSNNTYDLSVDDTQKVTGGSLENALTNGINKIKLAQYDAAGQGASTKAYWDNFTITAAGDPSLSIDEDTGTYWIPDPANEAGAWIKWDIGSVKGLGGCRVYFGADAAYRPTALKIEISTDDITYTEKVTVSSDPGSGWDEYTFTGSARYIRLTVTTHGSSGTKIYEFDHYEKGYSLDYAYGKITFDAAPGVGVAITADYTYYVTGTIDDSKTEGSSKKWDTVSDFNLWTLDIDLDNEGGYIKQKCYPYQDGSMTDLSQIDLCSGGPAIDPWTVILQYVTEGTVDAWKADGWLKMELAFNASDTAWGEQEVEWTFTDVPDGVITIKWNEVSAQGVNPSHITIKFKVDNVWQTVVDRDYSYGTHTYTGKYKGQNVQGVRVYQKAYGQYGVGCYYHVWIDEVTAYNYQIRVYGKNGDIVKVYEGATLLDTETVGVSGYVDPAIVDCSGLPFNGDIKINDGTTERSWSVSNIARLDTYKLRNYQATQWARSPNFKPANSGGWDQLKSSAVEGSGNDIQFYVIDPNNGDAVLLGPINYEDLPYDISAVTQEEIAVKVKFINNGKVTDQAVDWVQLDYSTGGIDITFTNEIAYKAIKKVSEVFIRDFYFDLNGLINIVTERTRDKTSIEFKHGDNLEIISVEDDFFSYANKITVLGDGVSATTQDDSKIAELGGEPKGVIHKTFVNKDLKDANTCGGYAEWLLDAKSKSNVVVKAKITGLNEALLPGDKVHVNTSVLNDNIKISKITYSYGAGGEDVEIEFRYFIPRITDYLRDIDLTKRWTL